MAVERDGLTRCATARFYKIAISTVVKWVRQYRESGSVSPKQMGGYKPKAIRGDHREWLVERCRGADFTLRGLVAELAERGLKVDYHTMWDFVHDEGLTFKKRR
jgi:putative transposase